MSSSGSGKNEGIWAPGSGDEKDWLRAPGPDDPLPGVNDRLAPPETRLEYLDGIEMFAAPADPPHAMQHFDLTYVLGAHVSKGYRGAVDMLTRSTHTSDFAPDASVFSTEIDPTTGGRRLEELAFEVVGEQPLRVTTSKARELIQRGVRRVFCIVVRHRRLLEWDASVDTWRTLATTDVIDDPCLARPLPVRALLETASGDDAVVEALRARNVGAIHRIQEESEAKGRADGEATGEAKGRAESILDLLEDRGLEVPAPVRQQVLDCTDQATLRRWLGKALSAQSADEVVKS